MKVLDSASLGSVRFRSISGQRVVDLYQQLMTTLVRQYGGDDGRIGHLFARPSINRRQDKVEWITTLSGNRIQRFKELDETAQQTALADLSTLLSMVAAISTQSDSRLGEMKELMAVLATEPDVEDIFVVDGQPVLINWGCEAREVANPVVGLFNVVPTEMVPSAKDEALSFQSVSHEQQVVYVENRRSWGWLWPLLFLLLLLLLLSFLLRGCEPIGLSPAMPGLMGGGASAPRFDTERNLRAEINQLNTQLQGAVQACISHPLSEADQRLQEHGSSAGVVNIALTWNNRHDLDLFVLDPNGEKIFFKHKKSRSGGYLDIDMNAAAGKRVSQPIENIKWDGESPPVGKYEVFVVYYDRDPRDSSIDPTPFTLSVQYKGKTEVVEGSIQSSTARTPIKFYEFTVD